MKFFKKEVQGKKKSKEKLLISDIRTIMTVLLRIYTYEDDTYIYAAFPPPYIGHPRIRAAPPSFLPTHLRRKTQTASMLIFNRYIWLSTTTEMPGLYYRDANGYYKSRVTLSP